MSRRENETGIEELRRAVRAADMTRESAFDGFTAEQVIAMIRACWASSWDVLPDELTEGERAWAALNGELSPATEARLAKMWGNGHEGESATERSERGGRQ